MTTNAFLRFDPGTVGIDDAEWAAFAADHALSYDQGRGAWVVGEVRIERLPSSDFVPHGLDVSTFFRGGDTPLATGIALAAWVRWGGSLQMADEMRALVGGPDRGGTGMPEQRERLVA